MYKIAAGRYLLNPIAGLILIMVFDGFAELTVKIIKLLEMRSEFIHNINNAPHVIYRMKIRYRKA